MANYDVGPLPRDAQLEAHLPPQPDDADFDAPPAGASVGIWGMLVAYDHEIRALKRRVAALEKKDKGQPLPVELVQPHEFGLLRTEDD